MHVSNAGQMGKRIMKSFTTYICERVIGWGLQQKLTIEKLLQSFDIEQSLEIQAYGKRWAINIIRQIQVRKTWPPSHLDHALRKENLTAFSVFRECKHWKKESENKYPSKNGFEI